MRPPEVHHPTFSHEHWTIELPLARPGCVSWSGPLVLGSVMVMLFGAWSTVFLLEQPVVSPLVLAGLSLPAALASMAWVAYASSQPTRVWIRCSAHELDVAWNDGARWRCPLVDLPDATVTPGKLMMGPVLIETPAPELQALADCLTEIRTEARGRSGTDADVPAPLRTLRQR